jgi:N-acetylmuramic acid 6-phosphate etherase
VDAALPRLRAGGRLLYAGAGTSGRLGVLDSVELLPTFFLARGARARACSPAARARMFQAVEGAEDDAAQGGARPRPRWQPGAQDVVIGIAASGTTPYVLGALARGARQAGALTLAVCNNPGAPVAAAARSIAIVLDTGAEVISGSTRLKAGTAQKIALNTLSSALMVRLHKVYGNLMVDLRATNAKLRARALRLTVRASGAGRGRGAPRAGGLRRAGEDGHRHAARGAGRRRRARARLEAAQGSVDADAGAASGAPVSRPRMPAGGRALTAQAASAAPRLRALDAFRGATVALMILVNNPGSWQHLYPPLAHAPWHGCTPTDLVFPFFLFRRGQRHGDLDAGLVRPPRPAQAALQDRAAHRAHLRSSGCS